MQPHNDSQYNALRPDTAAHHARSVRPVGRTRSAEHGQALVEYALIAVFVALVAGVALAATGPVIGNVFSNSISDLLRQTELRTPIPDREEFWATVTAVFLNPPVENPLPTNTKAPPTSVPTDGPSPTPTPVSPTPTPSPTRTPSLTPTLTDIFHEAPFYDSVEEKNLIWWRADPNINTSGSPWTTTFYSDAFTTVIKTFKGKPWGAIDYTGTTIQPWDDGLPTTNFWVRADRELQLAEDTVITIRMLADDDARVLVNGNPVNGLTATNSDGKTWFVGTVYVNGTGLNDPATPAPPTLRVPVRVEYRQGGGASRLYVSIQSAKANPDDVAVTGAGAPAAPETPFACGWGQNFRANGNDANTELGMFDEFVDAEMPANARCHLELRGAITVPASFVNPQLVFYDVWDLKNAAAAIEIANYIQATDPLPGGTPAPVPSANRSQFKWGRINLHTANTRNYNYTRNVINLKDVKLSDGSALDLTKPVTMRFVITRTGSGTPNRWYIDDISVADAGPEKVFYLNQPAWDLNSEDQMNDFVFTGGKSNLGTISGWRLQSHNKYGPSGMAFHDSVNIEDTSAGVGTDGAGRTQYKRFTEAPNTSTNELDWRFHTLEFNGWISFVNAAGQPIPVDAAGNRGDPVLEFYQAMDVGSRTGLEVQYKTPAAGSQWEALPNGVLRDVSTTTTATNITMQLTSVSLKDLPGNPNRIRIRFVMKVPGNSVRRDGWWIDQIRVGREESPKWVDYPLYDDAQYSITGPWRFSGMWNQTDVSGRRNDNEPIPSDPDYSEFRRKSYSSSPAGNYTPNGGQTAMELRFAWDVFNDTQNDAAQGKEIWNRPITTPINASNTGGEAVAPILTFYHWRDMASSDNFYVDWKRLDEPDTAWKRLWFYKSADSTIHNQKLTRTLQQQAWEYIEIDLGKMMTDIGGAKATANVRDDDIVLRFMLEAKNASASGRGLFIDDINIRERYDRNTPWNPASANPNAPKIAFNLWPTTENRRNPATNQFLGNGSGTSLFDDPDSSTTRRLWSESWFAGADWYPQTWGGGSRSGLYGFHDSPVGGQHEAPDGLDNYVGQAEWMVPKDTFRVLELNNVIDLRPVNADTEMPVLYWWQRYHLGGNNIAMVQISHELINSNGTVYTEAQKDTDIRARCDSENLLQCYEQNRGWSAWTTVWSLKANNNSELRSYGWTRGQVDLAPYARDVDQNRFGTRVRVRFVLDSLDPNTNWERDGWYIDMVEATYARPINTPVEVIPVRNGYTYDPASKGLLPGFIPEGTWGVDTSIVEGSAGTTSTLGTWNARWWNCNTCAGLPGANGDFPTGAGLFLQDPARRTPDFQNTTLAINYNMGNGKPPGAPAAFPTERFVGELVVDTPVMGVTPGYPSGTRIFQVSSDDGVRVKYERLVAGVPQPNTPDEWNVINKWQNQSATTNSNIMVLEYGQRYRITIQYFENSGGATLTGVINSGTASMSDSPKQGGIATRDAYPLPYGNTSLLGRQILDMSGISTNSIVILSYRTKYRLGSKTKAHFEVSSDGGFSWVQTSLGDVVSSFDFDSPTFSNTVRDPSSPSTTWLTRMHNLNAFKGQQIMIRFRFDRQTEQCLRTRAAGGSDNFPTQCGLSGAVSAPEYINGYFDGWWIGKIDIIIQ